jgi:hypothetical protein
MSNYNYLEDIDECMDEAGANNLPQQERTPMSNYDRLMLKGKADSGSNRSFKLSPGNNGAGYSGFNELVESAHSDRKD